MNTELNAMRAHRPFHTSRKQTNKVGGFTQTLKDAKWLVSLSVLVIGGLGIGLALYSTPSYKASAKLVVVEPITVATVSSPSETEALDSAFYNTQLEILRSKGVLLDVIKALSLTERFKNNTDLLDAYPPLIPEQISKHRLVASILQSKLEHVTSGLTVAELQNHIVDKLRNSLSLEWEEGSQVISLQFQSKDAQFASEFITALVRVYSEFGLNASLQEIENTETWRRNRIEELRLQLENAKRRLAIVEEQQAQLSLESPETPETPETPEATARAQSIVAAESASDQGSDTGISQGDFERLNQRFEALQAGDLFVEEFYALAPISDDPVVSPLLLERKALEDTLELYFPRYKEKHPKMIELRNAFEKIDRQLIDASSDYLARVQAKIQPEQAVADDLSEGAETPDESAIRDSSAAAPSADFIEQTIRELQDEVASNQRLYDSFLKQSETLNLSKEASAPSVKVIESGEVPQASSINKPIIALLFIGLGLIFGVFLAYLKAQFFYRLKSDKQVKSKLGLQNLGQLGLRRSKDSAALPELNYLIKPHSSFAKSIDSIRSKLLSDDIDNPPKVMLISSANPGEGKSTLALNLAASLGQVGRTLLIEVNLRAPCISDVLKTPPYSGLTDVLTNTIDSQEAIFKVLGPSDISILSCGSLPDEPLNIIKSAKFATLLDHFRNEFDFILLDGPAALSFSDVDYLLPYADGIILTAFSGQTLIKDSKRVVEHFKQHHGKILGCVLMHLLKKNGVNRKRSTRAHPTRTHAANPQWQNKSGPLNAQQ
uniref:GumC family protein n=1 Tax=Ningiella ruwaisensis TaxID=2364274 RepID=UPI00109F19E5|nr:polysaccharide biosynthesis tyrosine autokinase [Ningiella ruwaisensis]